MRRAFSSGRRRRSRCDRPYDHCKPAPGPPRPGRAPEPPRLLIARSVDVVKNIATEAGVCTRPVSLRRTDLDTGATTTIDIPCGATPEIIVAGGRASVHHVTSGKPHDTENRHTTAGQITATPRGTGGCRAGRNVLGED